TATTIRTTINAENHFTTTLAPRLNSTSLSETGRTYSGRRSLTTAVRLDLAERDRLRAVPQRQAAELGKLLLPLDERREVMGPERARFRGEVAVAVRKEQLRLALSAGIQRELAGMRVRRRILGADAEVAVAPRDPVRLAAPAAVDDAVVERQDRSER